MSYERQNFTDGQVLKAEHLNKIEDGIENSLESPVTAQVGQTIIVKEVDANGKPTKWEAAEYQPRTHWSEETVILPAQEAAFNEDAGGFIAQTDVAIVEGKTYTVTYNGTPYVGTCVGVTSPLEDGGFVTTPMFGNIGLMSGTGDTGEPFVLSEMSAFGMPGMYLIVNLDGAETVTIAIAEIEYKQIPREYVANYIPFYFDCQYDGQNYMILATPAEVRAAVEAGRQVTMRFITAGTELFATLLSMTSEEHTFAAGSQEFKLRIENGVYSMGVTT